MVSVGIIRARSVSTRGMRWTGLNFRVGMRPGLARQMQPRRIQWIKTERREDRRVSLWATSEEENGSEP
ncbi:hypothetical protein EV363DRAFT_1179782 [Boletus edulis]|nr:hypothetical protein EV363DRAFT_1179782 [Boletus edulis]